MQLDILQKTFKKLDGHSQFTPRQIEIITSDFRYNNMYITPRQVGFTKAIIMKIASMICSSKMEFNTFVLLPKLSKYQNEVRGKNIQNYYDNMITYISGLRKVYNENNESKLSVSFDVSYNKCYHIIITVNGVKNHLYVSDNIHNFKSIDKSTKLSYFVIENMTYLNVKLEQLNDIIDYSNDNNIKMDISTNFKGSNYDTSKLARNIYTNSLTKFHKMQFKVNKIEWFESPSCDNLKYYKDNICSMISPTSWKNEYECNFKI